MYTESIKSNNKIITYDDIYEIIYKMNEKLEYFLKIYENEKIANEKLNYDYQKWTFKDTSSKLNCRFYLKDGTSFDIDNYNEAMRIFNERIEEVETMFVRLDLNYTKTIENGKNQYYGQHIFLKINENSFEIDSSLASDDMLLEDVYNLISDKVYNAKERYDDVIKKRGLYTNIVGFPIGFVIAFIAAVALYFVPLAKELFQKSYIGFPIITLVISFVLGNMIGGAILNKLYEVIAPKRKYDGYDTKNHVSIYKDDIEEYTRKSEVLIGKNTHNLEIRNKIRAMKDKMKKVILIEIALLVIASIVVIIL